ncbi:ankyrin repeat-containing domain protein [Hypoxylon argillaceum]|nr:ankyrin repeat-containing domain protein [Hypoxylon argillaceum]
MKPETVTKETDRYGDKSTLTRLALRNSSPPPLVDGQVAVCTPQPIKMEFDWPATLPWLRFSSRELPGVLKACKPFKLESQHAPSSDLISTILSAAFRTDMAHIGVSKLAAIIGRSMPERYPQENLERAQNLLKGPAEDFMREYVSMTIYNVSNNALDLDQDDKWEQTMKVLEDCDVFRLGVKLGEDRSPTIDGFIEKLFKASIHRCLQCLPTGHRHSDTRAESAVKWLVASGYCPNTTAEAIWTRLGNPGVDDYGIQQFVLDLTKTLLDAGASANMLVQNCGKSRTILEIALQQPWYSDIVLNLAELLFKHGASRNLTRALHLAIRRKENDLVEMVVRHGGDLTADLESFPERALHKKTAVTVAASTGFEQIWHILHILCLRYPSIPLSTFIVPDVLIAAAAKGHDEIIHSLYETSPTIVANEYGITPLHAAARYGHLSTCQVLLSLKDNTPVTAKSPPPPPHAACYGGHKDVVEFLIRKGADVDAPPRFHSSTEEQEFKARLSMPYDGYGIAPLDMLLHEADMLSHEDDMLYSKCVMLFHDADMLLHEAGPFQRCSLSNALSCAIVLIRAGAKLVGSELSLAGKYCHLELLAVSIAAGANPAGLDKEGKTALQCALQGATEKSARLYEAVSQLLSKGAQLLGGEVNTAVRLKQYNVARLLMEHGGHMTKTALREELEKAILVRSHTWVDAIFRVEPSIYSAGSLYAAIVMGNDSWIQSLMQNRPTETSEDPFEVTAIAVAATSGNLVLLQKLLAHPPSCYIGPLPLKVGYHYRDERAVCSSVEGIRSGKYQLGGLLDVRSASHEFHGSPLALLASSRHYNTPEACSYILSSGFYTDDLTLVVAASSHNNEFVQVLLNHGQHVGYSHQDYKGRSSLAYAIEHENQELIPLLLKAGVDANGRGRRVGEPLCEAVEKGDLNIVDYLVKAGADVDGDDSDEKAFSPLRKAVENGKLDIVDYLIQANATVNINSRSSKVHSPLVIAVLEGRLDIVESLLRAGADVNFSNFPSPLHIAMYMERWDIVDSFLRAGADVNFCDFPFLLRIAVDKERLDIVDSLLRARTDVGTPSWGYSALETAVRKGRLDIVDFLFQAGADINPPNNLWSWPLLNIAVDTGRLEVVNFLLGAGADVNLNCRSWQGHSPLETAVKHGKTDIVYCLVQAGANINTRPAKERGGTPLQFAAINGHLGLAKYLIDKGAEVNAPPSRYG